MKKDKFIILMILYLGFVSLGLPDCALGVSWPSIMESFSQPLERLGILVSLTAFLTAASSLASGYIIKRFSLLKILVASGLLTTSGMLGYAFAPDFGFLILATVLLGIGAGAIDSSLNSYVAENYSSAHMNWLHGCWGVGAALGPFIMTIAVSRSQWQNGYLFIAFIQAVLVIAFIASRKSWKTPAAQPSACVDVPEVKTKILSLAPLLAILFFFGYTALESSIGVWFYSVMTNAYKINPEFAGFSIVAFWSSLLLGRFAIGLISNKLGNRRVISYSLIGGLLSLALLLSHNQYVIFIGLCFAGLSFASIYPSQMHETPHRFNKAASKCITGFQVGGAALGVAILNPLIGIAISKTSLTYLIPYLIILLLTLMLMNKKLNHLTQPPSA